MAASITSIHPWCFSTMHFGKHEKLAESELLHIYNIIPGMSTSVVASLQQALKCSWFQLSETTEGMEVSAMTLDLSLSVSILRCHNSVRDVICSASNLFKSLKTLLSERSCVLRAVCSPGQYSVNKH